MCSIPLVHPASKFDEIRSRHRPESDRFSEHEHGHFVCPALNVLFVIMKAHHLAQSGDISSLWPSAEPRRIWMWTARSDLSLRESSGRIKSQRLFQTSRDARLAACSTGHAARTHGQGLRVRIHLTKKERTLRNLARRIRKSVNCYATVGLPRCTPEGGAIWTLGRRP